MAKIAILIKTFEREKFLFECIESIKEHLDCKLYRIYVSDDGHISNAKEIYYKELENEGHFILRLPVNMGASIGRIAVLPFIIEEFILRMDDDFLITGETRIDKMLKILQSSDTIGAVTDLERQKIENKGVKSGRIRERDSQGYIRIFGTSLVKVFIGRNSFKYQSINGIRFSEIDFGRNFLLLKKELLAYAIWDSRIKFSGEHLDFMLQIKKSNKYILVFTPDSIHLHAGPPATELKSKYKKIRFDDSLKTHKEYIFKTKWNIDRFFIYYKDANLYSKLKTIAKIALNTRFAIS